MTLVTAPAASKSKRELRVVQPQLRILSVEIAPQPYRPDQGPLQFAIEVQLPVGAGDGMVLEVSSLITSPSKRSMRFLTAREPLDLDASGSSEGPSVTTHERTRVLSTLVWDGVDQAKQMAESGPYQYEIRAKLLIQDERGMRTQMVSWPKRGTLLVTHPHATG